MSRGRDCIRQSNLSFVVFSNYGPWAGNKMTDKIFKAVLRYCGCFILYAVCLHTFGFSTVVRSEGAEVVGRIVAVVNDDIIDLFELNRSFKAYSKRIKALGYTREKEKKMLFKVREDVLNRLIDEKLTDQEIKRSKIVVNEKAIDSTIERIKKAGSHTEEDLMDALAREGLTMEEYRNRIREKILRSKLVNLKVKSKIVITKEDIKFYYDSHINQYQGLKKYHLRNIIMKVSSFADEEEKLLIFNKMEAVLKKLNKGHSFENMSRSYSESPLAAEGGDLGFFKIDELSPQLRAVIKGMKAGEFTPIMDTDQGYQIFYVQDIIKASGKTIADASSEIQETLYNEIVDNKFHAWLEDLRKKSHIKIVR